MKSYGTAVASADGTTHAAQAFIDVNLFQLLLLKSESLQCAAREAADEMMEDMFDETSLLLELCETMLQARLPPFKALLRDELGRRMAEETMRIALNSGNDLAIALARDKLVGIEAHCSRTQVCRSCTPQ